MCRSIKTLRPPYTVDDSEDAVRAAALQYVRKVSGYRSPSRANQGGPSSCFTRRGPTLHGLHGV